VGSSSVRFAVKIGHSHSLRFWWDYLFNPFTITTMNHVALCCDCQLRSYRDGWLSIRLKKYRLRYFSNIGIHCRFVIKRGHIFSIPLRVKFIHIISLQKCKNLVFHENWGRCTAMIAECPFKYRLRNNTCIFPCFIQWIVDYK